MQYPEIIISVSIAQLIGFGIIVWKTATIYSEFNYRINKIKDDLNGLAKRIENKVDYNYSIINNRVNHLSEHLERKDGYHSPTFDRYDD